MREAPLSGDIVRPVIQVEKIGEATGSRLDPPRRESPGPRPCHSLPQRFSSISAAWDVTRRTSPMLCSRPTLGGRRSMTRRSSGADSNGEEGPIQFVEERRRKRSRAGHLMLRCRKVA
jgi:hypothetical protein